MRYPTEAELIEMERRAELLVEHAEKSRLEAAAIFGRSDAARADNRWHEARRLEQAGRAIEVWADDQERIADDFASLVAILKDLQAREGRMTDQPCTGGRAVSTSRDGAIPASGEWEGSAV